MIFRAIFWIGLVALLMPREPDLGLGRPAAASVSRLAGMAGLSVHVPVCQNSCAGGLPLLQSFQDKALRGLAEVKADIDASRRMHASSAL